MAPNLMLEEHEGRREINQTVDRIDMLHNCTGEAFQSPCC